jgi:ubiquinone/menaquinone biosynthesis C-methylase UbiE
MSLMSDGTEGNPDERYYTRLAACFVRGKIQGLEDLTDEQAVTLGRARGLRLHKFKRQAELPRVRRVLGLLRALAPASLLDIGSGRGAFIWPLLDEFPLLDVTSLDISVRRVEDIDATRRGGVANLRAINMDATRIDLPDKSFDVVTALEVFEHIPQVEQAVSHAIRVARQFVIVSVPSKADENPEHVHYFTPGSLGRLLSQAGAAGVKIEHVLNHMIAVARV